MQTRKRSFSNRITIGVILLGISCAVFYYNRSFRANAIKTVGTVVEVEISKDNDDGSLSYYPTYEYQDIEGTLHLYKPSVSRGLINKGEKEVIFYKVDKPSRALRGESSFGFFSIFPLLLGTLILISIPITILIRRFRQYRKTNLLTDGIKITIPSHLVFVKDVLNKDSDVSYLILGQWYDKSANKVYMFESEILPKDPSKKVKDRAIDVYISKKSKKNYLLDLSFLQN